ncbi:RDD family protein [Pontimonas salivibrio]|uniref:RDD family protein n=1 Tax=Pontimonas salivibrio TaxID=1159327 RepID=UPI001FE8E38E|nr:RDD family protein [Pontimonas salivibrio]
MEQSDNYWPGKRFGLPEEGPRSTPGWNRRIAGIIIDWVLALGLSALFFGFNNLSILGVFVLLHIIGGLLAAGSPGHLLMKIRIAPIAGGRLGILAPVVRPLLIALVIPALMSDDDRRGAHDRLVGTILVTR